jgi:hypothetical protein
MEEFKAFMVRLGEAVKKTWDWFKGLPIAKPVWALVYSRKSVISAALVTFALTAVPALAPAKDTLAAFIAQVVIILLAALAQSLGIALEDQAEKSGTVITTTMPSEAASTTVTSVTPAPAVGEVG